MEHEPVYSLKYCGSGGARLPWEYLLDLFLVYLLTFKIFEGIVSVEVDVIHEDDDVLAGIQKSSVVQIGHQVHDTIQITQEDINWKGRVPSI